MENQAPVGQNQRVGPTVMIMAPRAQNLSWAQCWSSNKTRIILGSIQFFLGIISIVFNITAIIVKAELSPVSHGIWSGIIFILAGVFGILAAKRGTRRLNVTSLVFSIIAAELCIPILILCSFGIKMDEADKYKDYNQYQYGYREAKSIYWQYKIRHVMNGIIIAIAVVEAIIAVFAAILGCQSVCRDGTCEGVSESELQQVQVVGTGKSRLNGQSNSTQYTNQTFQPTQVLVLPALTGSMQTGFTAPAMMTTGGPPAYSHVQPTPAVNSTPETQNEPPPEPDKESVSVSLNKPLMG